MTDFLKNLQPKQNSNKPSVEDLYKTDQRPIEECFSSSLPDNLYKNHYELAETFPQHTAESWRRYLKENDRFILQEVAAVTEASARQGLQRLASGLLKQGDATAITQLLNRSEQINQSVKDKTVYMTTFLPDPNDPTNKPKKGIAEQVKDNKAVSRLFYPQQVFFLRESRGEMVENEDGTLHFPNPEAMTHLDRIYLHFHNPENLLVNEIVDGDLAWQ